MEQDFLTLCGLRHSVRRFTGQPVPREDLQSCIEAARLAPSAENVQPWRFLVIDDQDLKQALVEKACSGIYRPTRFIGKAAALVLALARLDILANRIGSFLQGTQFYLLDLGIACEHLVLRATELGIGSCYIGWFDEGKARRVLALPKRYRITCLIALGYGADDKPKPHKRKPLHSILHFNRVGDEW